MLRYGISRCDLGYLIIAASETGVRTIRVSSECAPLLADLEAAYGASSLVHDPMAVKNARVQVEDFLAGKRAEFDLTLDLEGTDFQQSVWKALREVPYGTTVPYSDIAEFLGMAGAVRAVANACGDNPALLAVPCHRIIRKDGDIGGFGCGVDRKRHLLELEQRKAPILTTRNEKTLEFSLG